MTAPIWMAMPPEVHSSLLSSGPGPGSMLAAAGAWQSLSLEYSTAAAELTALLGTVQAGAWEGPSAERYLAAHVPYLAWLAQASANSAVTALAHETAAAAYTTALAMTPTLPELATNHVVHGVLLGTNFFGINTIPIALNEADYVRMWVQAATAMGIYQAIAGAVVAAAPTTAPAPFLLAPGVGEAGTAAASAQQSFAQIQAVDAGGALNNADVISSLLQFVSQLYSAYTDYTYSLFEPIINFLSDPIGNSVDLIVGLLTNPGPTLVQYGPFLFAVAYQAVSWVGASLTYPNLLLPLFLPLAIGLGQYIYREYLERLAVPDPAPEPAPAGQPAQAAVRPVASPLPAASVAPTVPTGTAAPAATSVGGGTAPAPAPVASAAAPFVPYAVAGGGPGSGPTPTLRDGTGAKAPASDLAVVAAAAAAASAIGKRRARRRRGAAVTERGYRDEYMDLEADPATPEPPAPQQPSRVTAAASGAGAMGFTGTAGRADAAAAGLTELPGDAFGGGPRNPMLPGTWDPDEPEGTPRT